MMKSYSPKVSLPPSAGRLPASLNSPDKTLKLFFPTMWFGGTQNETGHNFLDIWSRENFGKTQNTFWGQYE